MNNNLNDSQLESLLRDLAPAAASPALTQRVDDELKLDMSWLSTSRRKPHRSTTWLMSAGWAAMGAAAAIAVMSHLPNQDTQGGAGNLASSSSTTVLPASTIREWDDTNDNAIHRGRSSLAEKRTLVISRELQTWVDPRYSTAMTVEVPSQHNLLPVSYK